MNAELTMNRDIRLRLLGAGKGRSIIRSTSTTANMFNQTVAGFYISVEELGFSATVTKTAGSAIVGASNNAYLDVRRCEFTSQFRHIDLSSSAANVGTINECLFTSPASTAGGSQIRINGAGINMMIQNCTINVTGVDTNGLEIKQCGAIQVSTCDFIGGRNTLLVNATNIISALYFTNCFFDQATFGSTVKFIGTAATSRVKFVQCGITNGGGSGLVALEIAGTGSGTGIPEAIDFMLCDFYNNGFAGTTTGILATGVRGFDLTNCRISGFTFGIDITSFSANGVTNFNIQGCTIGPTENFAANGTGIRINAGSFTYASSSIADNDLSGNTTVPIVQNGNFAGTLVCKGNQGLANGPLSFAPTLVTNAAVYLGGLAVPPNSLTTKTRFRITLLFSNTAATLSNTTVRIKWGTAATTGDGNIFALTTTGTAAAGFAKMTFEIAITVLNAATGTSVVHMVLQNGANAATGFHNAALLISNTSTATLNTTTAANFLGLELLGSVTNIHTLQSGTTEVVSQGY